MNIEQYLKDQHFKLFTIPNVDNMILPNYIMDWLVITAVVVIIYVVIITSLRLMFPEQYLDWKKIDLQDISFPDNFTWGVATASHQIEGNNVNNWTQFEQRENKELLALLVITGNCGIKTMIC